MFKLKLQKRRLLRANSSQINNMARYGTCGQHSSPVGARGEGLQQQLCFFLFFFLFFILLICFPCWFSLSLLFWPHCIWNSFNSMVEAYSWAAYTDVIPIINRNEGNIILNTVSHSALIKIITSRFMFSITFPAVSRLYLSSNLIAFLYRLWKLPPSQR